MDPKLPAETPLEPEEDALAALRDELEERRALTEAVFAASYDGICILDREGVFLEVNAAYERMTGIPRAQWVGRRVEQMQKLPGVPRQSATLQALRTNRPASTLVNVRGGELVLITASPHFGPDGAVRNVIMNTRNITQLNALKHQLERERGSAKLADLEKARRSWLRSRLAAADLDDLVFASPVMDDLLSTAAEIADFDSTVLLDGETGTGKGMLARFLHRLSRRADKPFVEINCGALPESLVESELFGHEAGAFTGSLRTGKKGQFELANGGTVFLDEIGELPLASQAKLLKVLDDKEIRPLGAAATRRLDVRVVCATNRNLHDLVAAGRFREDLLYRIEVIPLHLSPLRERPEDKKALLYAFLDRYNRQCGRDKVLSLEAVAALGSYDFPGNVRELRNLVERLVMTTRGEEIGVEQLPPAIQALASAPGAAAAREALVEESLAEVVDYRARVEKLERQMLHHFARSCRSTYEIARRTGLTQSAVVRKLKKYGISLAGVAVSREA
ncbi:MAG: sigma 54-interacting transcriptional regulator [Deltaproteobacteria bacterium]|nr:sigma 54-interacting transcriptional regulator [Deltaproteobacteria bacterium]